MDAFRSRLYRLLRWSERYTKTDMVYLFRGSFWSIVGQGTAALLTLGLAVVMARFVAKDVYGDYKYILAVLSILGTFSLTGIGSAVLQSISRGYLGSLKDGFWANLKWSFPVFIGAFSFGAYYLLHGNTDLGLGILLGGCISPFLASFNLYLPLLSGKKDFATLAWYSDFVTNFIPAGALIYVAYFAPRPLPLLATYFLSNLVAAAFAYWKSAKKYDAFAGEHDPEMVTYSKHLSLIGVLNGIASNIDQILIFHFIGPIQLAIYNFATALPDQAKGPLKTLDQMVQVQFARRSEEEIHRDIGNKYFWLFLATVAGILFYIWIAPFLYHVLFPKYPEAVFYSRLYAISYFFTFLAPATSYLVAKKKVSAQYVSSIASSIFRIIVLLIGVLWGGFIGLMIALVISRSMGVLISYIFYRWPKLVTR